MSENRDRYTSSLQGERRKLCLVLVSYNSYKVWLNTKAIVSLRSLVYGRMVCFSVTKANVLADGAWTPGMKIACLHNDLP